MPYGSGGKYSQESGLIGRVNEVLIPSGMTSAQTKVLIPASNYNFPAKGEVVFSRSGSNRNSFRIAKKDDDSRPFTYQWIRVKRSVPKGPRLAYKIWNTKLNKFIWARKHIVVYRLKRVKVYTKRSMIKSSTLLVNDLSYRSLTMNKFGSNSLSTSRNFGYKVTTLSYNGDLTMPFVPVQVNDGPLLPDNFSDHGSTVSYDVSSKVNLLNDKALSLLYERVKNQNVNVAQAIAERAQATRMMTSTAIRIAQACLAMKSGNIVLASRKLFPGTKKEISNDWLMYQYGIKPLLSDLDGLAKFLAEPQRQSFDVVAEKSADVDSSATYNQDAFIKSTTIRSMSGKASVRYKARLAINMPTGNGDKLKQLGFTNPIALGWEVIPYSFVVDWFIPIGDYLNKLDAFTGLELLSVHKTVFLKEDISFVRSFGGMSSDFWNYPNQTVGYQATKVNVTRTLLSDVPPLPFPSFKDPVSKLHLANATALITQLLSKGK